MPLTEFKDVLLSFDPSQSSIMLLILHILTPWYVSRARASFHWGNWKQSPVHRTCPYHSSMPRGLSEALTTQQRSRRWDRMCSSPWLCYPPTLLYIDSLLVLFEKNPKKPSQVKFRAARLAFHPGQQLDRSDVNSEN